MRKLKFHEKKLVKKANFLLWKWEGGHHEAAVTQRYGLVDRDDYKKYNGICLMAQKLVNIIKQMDPRDPFRIEMTDMLIDKLSSKRVSYNGADETNHWETLISECRNRFRNLTSMFSF